MITPGYVHMMARYNTWQNQSLFDAADKLSEDERQQNRGAFFASIHLTLSHILWGDTIWMSRFDGWDVPEGGFPKQPYAQLTWDALKAKRLKTDARLLDWAGRVSEDDLTGDLSWFSGAVEREITKPRAMLIVHMFNHQTHHRGQVHAMLTAAGSKPDDTDIPFMKDT